VHQRHKHRYKSHHHRLRESPPTRRTDFDGDHREHGAVAAASANEFSAADALVSAGCTYLMLKARTAVMSGTLDRDHAVAKRWAGIRFR
jgi:hypothetical protein